MTIFGTIVMGLLALDLVAIPVLAWIIIHDNRRYPLCPKHRHNLCGYRPRFFRPEIVCLAPSAIR